MHFNYTEEPHVICAAAQNPDNTWSICLNNMTGVHAQHYASYYTQGEALTYDVTIVAEELAGVESLMFNVKSANSGRGGIQDEGTVVMENGVLEISIESLEVLALKSQEPAIEVKPKSVVSARTLAATAHSVTYSGGKITIAAADSDISAEILHLSGRVVARTQCRRGQAQVFSMDEKAHATLLVRLSGGGMRPETRKIVAQ
jgi:hypothetical protein